MDTPTLQPHTVSNSIVHKVYELYLLFYHYSALFPKKDKFTLAIKIEQNIIEVMDFLMLAQTKDGSGKILILNKTDLKLKTLKLFVRMAYDVKAIDQKKYLNLEEKIIEIGKMLGGWIKHEKSNRVYTQKDPDES